MIVRIADNPELVYLWITMGLDIYYDCSLWNKNKPWAKIDIGFWQPRAHIFVKDYSYLRVALNPPEE